MKAEDYKILNSEYLFNRPWLTVRKDWLQLPSGQVNEEYYVLEYPDWINVVAITQEGLFVMEQQYRHGLGQVGIEICAGVIEKGETPLQAAQRELLEETGYSGGTWSEEMVLCANPSTTNNLSHSFLAVGVEKTAGQHLDRTEVIEPILMTADQVRELLVNDKVKQALMAAPLWKYFSTHGLL